MGFSNRLEDLDWYFGKKLLSFLLATSLWIFLLLLNSYIIMSTCGACRKLRWLLLRGCSVTWSCTVISDWMTMLAEGDKVSGITSRVDLRESRDDLLWSTELLRLKSWPIVVRTPSREANAFENRGPLYLNLVSILSRCMKAFLSLETHLSSKRVGSCLASCWAMSWMAL